MNTDSASFPRVLNPNERQLFVWCADRMSLSDSDAFRKQLADCTVLDEENGGLWFRVSEESPRVNIQGIDLHFSDIDGQPALFMIAFVEGHLNWVDRYRLPDSAFLETIVPEPDEITACDIDPKGA